MNIFEKAAKEKIRFIYNGIIMVEDLWDLSIVQLDELYRQISSTHQAQSDEGLVRDSSISEAVKILQLQKDLVHAVFLDREATAQKANAAKVLKEKKTHILSIIAKKQDDALSDKSLAELTAMLEDL